MTEPTPPLTVPEMPKPDGACDHEVHGLCFCWKADFTVFAGTTTIEAHAAEGWAKAAELAAEVERLREVQRVQVKNLLLSVQGSWEAFPHEIRDAIGNSKYNLIAESVDSLRTALGGHAALTPPTEGDAMLAEREKENTDD